MDVPVPSANESRQHPPVTVPPQPAPRCEPNPELGRAQPLMGQAELIDHPIEELAAAYQSILSSGDEIVVRRRASSTIGAIRAEPAGRHEMALVQRIAREMCHQNDYGAIKGARTLTRMGAHVAFGLELVEHHHRYRRILRPLAGGTVQATEAQAAQAFALCIFDINRLIFMRDMIEPEEEIDASSEFRHAGTGAVLHELVTGAKRLMAFAELRSTLGLWNRIRLDVDGADREVAMKALTGDMGLFHTNAERLLHAYAEARGAGSEDDLRARLRDGLAKQWLRGPGEAELDALRRVSCEQREIFHRKLIQQYGLLCHRFGLPLPLRAELILVDTDD